MTATQSRHEKSLRQSPLVLGWHGPFQNPDGEVGDQFEAEARVEAPARFAGAQMEALHPAAAIVGDHLGKQGSAHALALVLGWRGHKRDPRRVARWGYGDGAHGSFVAPGDIGLHARGLGHANIDTPGDDITWRVEG